MRRLGIGIGVMALAAAAVLGGAEAWRRNHLPEWNEEDHAVTTSIARASLSAGHETIAKERPSTVHRADRAKELIQECQRPDAKETFLAKVRAASIALNDRHRLLAHKESHHILELNPKGHEIGVEESHDLVWYSEGKERRRNLDRFDALNKKPLPKEAERETALPDVVYPLSREESPGDYVYVIEGMDEAESQGTIRMAFEPTAPLTKKFRGHVWIDPVTLEARRFRATTAKIPAFVDHLLFEFWFGPAENGHTQLKKSLVAGAGGFAFVRKHYRVETDHSDYGPLEAVQSVAGTSR